VLTVWYRHEPTTVLVQVVSAWLESLQRTLCDGGMLDKHNPP